MLFVLIRLVDKKNQIKGKLKKKKHHVVTHGKDINGPAEQVFLSNMTVIPKLWFREWHESGTDSLVNIHIQSLESSLRLLKLFIKAARLPAG